MHRMVIHTVTPVTIVACIHVGGKVRANASEKETTETTLMWCAIVA